MSSSAVLFERRGKVALITINRPEALNAINMQVWNELGHAFDDFAEDPNLLCAVLTGAGDRSFCAGADLKEKAVSKGESIIPEGCEKWGFAGIVQHYMNKPIIAAVNGLALGGGTEIALACDLIVASEKATFGLPEVKIGLIAGAGGLLRLPRQIPLKVAMEYILVGDTFSAEEVEHWGLVNRVVPHEQLLEEALALAERITENAPLAIRASKDIVYRGLDVALDHPDEAWAINQKYLQQVIGNEDSMEGIKAFIEKRKPVWQGR
ncbi:crotonase/enoyl-CoA hydratase family protein [Bacillus salipaludis]|uniref:Crotonase/enoyl-CoA hydratase family protein n=1 Tax=Bacillus salipaludis TaxID=2547811 RepID=A0ABW8RAL9_9BACI